MTYFGTGCVSYKTLHKGSRVTICKLPPQNFTFFFSFAKIRCVPECFSVAPPRQKGQRRKSPRNPQPVTRPTQLIEGESELRTTCCNYTCKPREELSVQKVTNL